MGITFLISYKGGRQIFLSGEEVSGDVEVSFESSQNERINIKGIEVILKGKAKWLIVGYAPSNGTGGASPTVNAKEHTFFEKSLQVYGDGKFSSISFDNGTYKYPFSIELPPDAPSSFKSKYGEIYYKIIVRLQSSGIKQNKKFQDILQVQGILNLASIEQKLLPAVYGGRKSIGCFLCSSGTVQFTLRFPGNDAYAGKGLPFTLTVNNSSSKVVAGVTLRLFQEVKYVCYNSRFVTNLEQKVCKEAVTEISLPGTMPGVTESWTRELRIPSDIPPSNESSKIIFINYFIRVRVSINGGFDLVEEIPVLIGNMPLEYRPQALSLVSQFPPIVTYICPIYR